MNAVTKVEASLASAMAAAFAEIEGATKSANNPHFKSKYADITAVIEAIKPALIKHDLYFTQHPEPSDRGVTIETWLHHAGGDSLSLGKLYVPANKQDAQGFGSALTYARRYALVTAFGVPTEDDDGNAAAKSQKEAPASMPAEVRDRIIQLCEAVGGNQSGQICKAYGVEAITDLTQQQADAVISRLNEKLAAKVEERPVEKKAKEPA